MNVGIIGLGRMGMAIAQRLIAGGFTVYGFDPNQEARERAEQYSIVVYQTQTELARICKLVWLMVPAGTLIDDLLQAIRAHLRPGAVVVDGGNSHFTDAIRRASVLDEHGIAYLDCGTSGGMHGLEHGFCLMVGGVRPAFEIARPVFEAVAAPDGYAYIGPSGTGHYVKMIHNGIEYALLQAYAEGFDLIKNGTFKSEDLDLAHIAKLWHHGSVIRSWLLKLCQDIFENDQQFSDISGYIAQGGTGKWTVEDAQKNNIPVPMIKTSLAVRKWSEQTGGNYATKIVALLRHAFGGHEVKKIKVEGSE